MSLCRQSPLFTYRTTAYQVHWLGLSYSMRIVYNVGLKATMTNMKMTTNKRLSYTFLQIALNVIWMSLPIHTLCREAKDPKGNVSQRHRSAITSVLLTITSTFFWDFAPCSLVVIYWRFGKTSFIFYYEHICVPFPETSVHIYGTNFHSHIDEISYLTSKLISYSRSLTELRSAKEKRLPSPTKYQVRAD
jgi:hypothetical protein